MPIPCYLAMTGAEFFSAPRLPEKLAWMACHYSCYGTGLSNLPTELPEDSLIIVNDRTPPDRHDIEKITEQLLQLHEELKPFGFLLDFQRQDMALNQEVAVAVSNALPCPVGVSELYAGDLDCPVFVAAPELHLPLSKSLAPWEGREIWLEAALQTAAYTVTESGCSIADVPDEPLPEPCFYDEELFCRYHMTVTDTQAVFTLQRSHEALTAMLMKASGVTVAVGLYQQLKNRYEES